MLASGALQRAESNTVWYVLIAIMLLIILIWWWMSRRNGEQVGVSPKAAVQVPEERRADDLTSLEGIGPKVAKVLNESGIKTFKSLAQANAADVQDTLNAAGLQMMNPEGWIEQAGLAANKQWDKLERLQAELKGGRRK